jgi:hypothetical protein
MPDEGLFLGEAVDPAAHARTGEQVRLDPDDLVTHGVIVGMTGSGKTGLAIDLLEELLLSGVPVLAIDPKGDLANLDLVFPALDAASFEPWVEAGGDAAGTAQSWKDGLAGWGLGSEQLQRLRDAAKVTVYTPGSTAGVPLNLIGAITRPPEGTDPETTAEQIESTVSGFLGLVGIEADPLATPEHILLANLVHHAWGGGEDIDLAGLVGRVLTPPIRKLGVLDIDAFIPEKDRRALATKLNGLLASPTAAAWSAGPPIDIAAMLRPEGPEGRPGAAIVSVAHLGDEERQFVIARLLGEVVTWMRRQPGTDKLRALVYFDEVLGFVPPVANPPSKPPMLRILKQARAFGVGTVLATQNPVDLDYKALANAGTWAIGRLQTEQDKGRLLDGMRVAAGEVDIEAISTTISGLAKREFVLRRAGKDTPTIFTTRWAMSYLRGPLTRDQLGRLPSAPPAAVATDPAPTATPADPATPATTGTEPATVAPAPAGAGPSSDDTPVAPPVTPELPVRWMAPSAPWAPALGLAPTATRFVAGLALRGTLTYDDRVLEAGSHQEEWEAVLTPLGPILDPATLHVVDHDDRDFLTEAPAGAQYELPDLDLAAKAPIERLRKAVVDHLVAQRPLQVSVNRELKLASRPGEAPEAFAARCLAAAEDKADADAAELRRKYQAKLAREHDQVVAAAERVSRAESSVNSSRSTELVDGAGSILGSLFGGRKRAGTIARSVSRAATRRRRSNEAEERLEDHRHRLGREQEDVVEMEAELSAELVQVVNDWHVAAAAIESVPVPLEKSDVAIVAACLLWLPSSASS